MKNRLKQHLSVKISILVLCTALVSVNCILLLKSYLKDISEHYKNLLVSGGGAEHSSELLKKLGNLIVSTQTISDVSIILIVGVTIISFLLCYKISNLLTSTDFITGLNNKFGFLRLIHNNHILGKKIKLHEYNALFINIKSFNYVNRKYGAKTGNIILREYAAQLQAFLKKGEHIACFGGDNFFALIKKERTEFFLIKLATMNFNVDINGKKENFVIDSRCGIYNVKEGDNFDKIIDSCSAALKNARTSPLGEFVVFKEDMMEIILNEKETVLLFPHAIRNKEFVVYYQPKVDLQTNKLCGCEALVRWIRDGKLVPPDTFIPILEKEGLINELDFYVLERVCQDLKIWKDNGKTPVKVSSNFSKLHLMDSNFSKKILDVLTKYEIDPDLVEVELTESSGYENYDALVDFIDNMNENNISTSIDDFGTGYSSLSLIKDLDVDVIKLDKSLINHIEEGDIKNEIMIKNIVTMIKDLGRDVICEGVETIKQAKYLKSVNCNVVQGFLCDKPLPHDEFEKKLETPEYKI